MKVSFAPGASSSASSQHMRSSSAIGIAIIISILMLMVPYTLAFTLLPTSSSLPVSKTLSASLHFKMRNILTMSKNIGIGGETSMNMDMKWMNHRNSNYNSPTIPNRDTITAVTANIKRTFASRAASTTISSSTTALAATSFSAMSSSRLYSSKSSSSSSPSSASSDIQPGIDIIQKHNPSLHSSLTNLRNIPYFRYYSCDMLASCEYMPQELFECYSQTCEIYPVDEFDPDTDEEIVPPTIRYLDVSEFEFDIDGWARWDMPSDDYYDIVEFGEEFTNYDGAEVWKFIHSKIAFEMEDDEVLEKSWKKDFNTIVSGMHSMISAHIVEGIQEKIDENDGDTSFFDEYDGGCKWTDPKEEYVRRLSVNGETPDAIQNMYCTFMLLLSAVQSSREYIMDASINFGCDENDIECDASVRAALEDVLSSPLLQNMNDDSNIYSSINVASSNLHDHAVRDEQSKHNLWEARMRSRELLRIMNCVQCNKCRLHGKIAAMGISTALQLLLGKSGMGIENQKEFQKIHRVELAALVTTLAKFSNAIEFCMQMEKEIQEGG
mmetsp:Transcript_23859/g.35469  ORF Transcript_23859/g.35469 Transcript_23859/m.35469 type:complete len:552 (+) Transcript_23859:258-1913(+)